MDGERRRAVNGGVFSRGRGVKVERGGKQGNAGATSASGGATSHAAARVREAVEPVGFADALAGVERSQFTAELDDLVRRLDEQAQVLVKRQTVTELEKYRELVTAFLSRVVKDAYHVEEVPSAFFLQNNKVFVYARQVEEKLALLAEEVRSGNADALSITASTSEIRGLLLDLRG